MEKEFSREADKRGYLLEDFRLFHLKDAKGTNMEYHYHEFCKLVLLVSGQGGYAVEEHHYTLMPGDILLIGSHHVHRPEFEVGMEYERIIFYISPEFLQRQSTGECNLETLFDGVKGHVLRMEEKRYKKLWELAMELEAEVMGAAFGKTVMGNSLLLRLLVKLGRYREKTPAHRLEQRITSNERVLNIMEYINAHLSEDLDIDELSERFYISKYHMMRLFRRETGQTVFEYLTEQRLFYARELIRRGGSATESCFQAGFGSYSSFTRAYGKRFGTTPTGRNGRYISMDEAAGEV